MQGAWPHIAGLLDPDSGEDESLLLAAIEAASGFESQETVEILAKFVDSDNEDIASAAHETLAMMEVGLPGGADDNW